ncbi:MAG: rhomboid family intramembrane serine protease [Bacteroidia bacterium]|nr:rhomboid family intramembrane serine protease [Bacteroidia bacterium]
MIPLRDTSNSNRRPYVTWFLIGINVVIFLFQLTLSNPELRLFFMKWGMVPLNISHPHEAAAGGIPASGLWTLVTSMFLHGGWGHLIFNMWALWIFGDNVEEKLGRLRFLGFYLVAGIIATLAHLLVNWTSPMPVVGASGALAGVMAAYMFFFPNNKILTFLPVFFLPFLVEIRAKIFIVIWITIQVISGMMGLFAAEGGSGVAFWAHIGGFAAGWLLARYFVRPKREANEFGGEYVEFEEV